MILSDLAREVSNLVDCRQRFFENQLRSLEPVFSLWPAKETEKQKLKADCWNLHRKTLMENLFFREQFLLILPSSQIPVSVQTRGLLPNLDKPDNLETVDRWKDVVPRQQQPYLILDPCAQPIDPRWYQRYRQYWIRQIARYEHVPMTLVEGITWLAHRHKLTHANIDYNCDYLILGTKGKGGKVIRILHRLNGTVGIVKFSVTPWKVKSSHYVRPQYLLTYKH